MSAPAVIAINPGPTESALVVFDGTAPTLLRYAANDEILALLQTLKAHESPCAIEMIASYGVSVGQDKERTGGTYMNGTEVRTERPVGGGGTTAPAVKVNAVKAHSNNTLRAFVDFTLLDIGLEIKGCAIHERENRRWLSLPSREYVKNGERTWIPVVEFSSREARDRITNAVLAAFDEFSTAGLSQGGCEGRENRRKGADGIAQRRGAEETRQSRRRRSMG